MTSICLNMIVRNEAKVICRALDSVMELIDYWVICDTGSTDDTPAIINDYFQEKNIPGELHSRAWINFGHNRNEALKLARGKGDYLLLVDADMVLQHSPEFDPADLVSDSYLLRQHNGDLNYYNKRLLKNSLNWRCIGVTHEYYACETDASEENLSAIWIDDIGDGGSKLDKFERDIALLEEGIRNEPENARYHFYLAQSYKDAGKTEKAIEMYDRRVLLGGWDEEVWYSRLMKGTCLAWLQHDREAINALQAAFDDRPFRAEPLVPLCEVLIRTGEYKKACVAAQLGNTIPFPDKDRLFIDTSVYQWRLDYQITLCAYYCREFVAGRDAVERLLLNRSTPGWVRQTSVMNLSYYIQSLPDTIDAAVVTKTLISETAGLSYINPSILKTESGYLANLRGINFYVEGNVYYESGSGKAICTETPAITRNFLQFLDDDLNSKNNAEEIEMNSIVKPATYSSGTIGYEDGRLIHLDGDTWLLSTCREHNSKNINQMALLHVEEDRVDRVLLLHGHEDDLYQKNWMPFIHRGELLLIYACEPLTVLRPNLDTGHCDVISSSVTPVFCGLLRGGSQGVRINDHYLFLVHEVAEHADGRHYYHRFLALDETLAFVSLSPAFYLQHLGIEFVAGLCVDEDRDELVIAWGYNDAEARFSQVPLTAVLRFLSIDKL